ncbi:hypothetical protein [Salibacterium sp. K-3]
MIWMLEPWLFYLLLSILLLGITFPAGMAIHGWLRKKEKRAAGLERISAIILAAAMAAVYLYAAELFTDRAALGERVVTDEGVMEAEHEQNVVIPFGMYAVVERLYDFGYTKEEEWQEGTIRYTFTITDGGAFLSEYEEYIEGNGAFVNRGRIAFDQLYEKEWKPELQRTSDQAVPDFPGVEVEQNQVTS